MKTNQKPMFAEILLNHPYSRQRESFTYAIPNDAKVNPGSGVIVPFGKNRKVGVVLSVKRDRPDFETKDILEVMSDEVLLQEWQLELTDWLTEYYFCSKLDVFKMMLPNHIWRQPKKERATKKPKKVKINGKDHAITPDQKKILDEYFEILPDIALIHGVTGSGKTEVYKKIIQNCIENGKQALLLVPEISLTPQLLKYFEKHIEDLAVIHSKISDGKKAKIWKDIRSGETKLVIGSRSALFSPFSDLGLIIMDEEHEWSYKQDKSPRYHTRDVAIKMMEICKAKLVLGSATPSIESMWKAKNGEYKLFSLDNRIHGTEMPNVEIVDMREELKKGNFSIFSENLEQKIRTALSNKEQTILFLNRRGTASATICRDCGMALECKNCDVRLTYHASKIKHSTLICHHCGTLERMPDSCPKCKSRKIKHIGIGTQKVQSEIEKLFPSAKVTRADKDTMSKRDSFTTLHDDLHNQKIDILIGTQMIGKGFDLPNVSLVGVIMADLGIHIPDFRATEHNFQLMTQVAGRCGRRESRGEVVIQTYSPDNPSVACSQTHDYITFFEQEISTRKSTSLPPFGKLVKLVFVNAEKKTCDTRAKLLTEKIKSLISEDHEVFSAPAMIPRIHNKYHWNILIQGENPSALIKKLTQEELEGWRIDVDPIHSV